MFSEHAVVFETLKQAVYLIRLFGLGTLVRRKRRHDQALPHMRGYALTRVLWALMHQGFLDQLLQAEQLDLHEYAREHGLDEYVLESLCEYLDALSLLSLQDGRCRPRPALRGLLAEPRGVFDLTYGYEPVFTALPDLLTGERKFGRDVERRGEYVARGSGELGMQLPFPVMVDLIRGLRPTKVLDLGAGDLEFLFLLARELSVEAVGIDIDGPAVAHAEKRLQESPYVDNIKVFRGDMFDVEELARRWGDSDVLTAVDVFHEYLFDGDARVRELLQRFRLAFPHSALVVGEFCLQPQERLRRQPTAFVEHHLFHRLTNQVILPAERWRTLFAEAGYSIVTERVFDMVGHGYFALTPTG